jgi:hypothetical protein
MHQRFARMNPAWTNSALARHWGDLGRLVPRSMLPKLDSRSATRLHAQEYGSGVYGTVMPTNKRGVVVKVTSDPTEAKFAYILSRWPANRYPPGLVRYFKVFQLSGQHAHRPIYILWREEAYNVGRTLRSDSQTADFFYDIRDKADPSFRLTSDEYDRRSYLRPIVNAEREFKGRTGCEGFGSCPGTLMKIRLAVASDATFAGYGVQAARSIANDMAHGSHAALVGAAIRDLIDHGLVLADVHLGNIGHVRRGGVTRTVITDPGNVAFLTRRYDGVVPPTIDQALGGRSVQNRRAAYR